MTNEELDLIKRLASPPKCMHNPKNFISHETYWECKDCGLLAKKIAPSLMVIKND